MVLTRHNFLNKTFSNYIMSQSSEYFPTYPLNNNNKNVAIRKCSKIIHLIGLKCQKHLNVTLPPTAPSENSKYIFPAKWMLPWLDWTSAWTQNCLLRTFYTGQRLTNQVRACLSQWGWRERIQRNIKREGEAREEGGRREERKQGKEPRGRCVTEARMQIRRQIPYGVT